MQNDMPMITHWFIWKPEVEFQNGGGRPFSKLELHCVSKKNIPNVFSYNSRKHRRIFIIFGRNISKKASNQNMLYYSTSPN